MGATLAEVHEALRTASLLTLRPAPRATETAVVTVARIDKVIAAIRELPRIGTDENSALAWLTAQRAWLYRAGDAEIPPAPDLQPIHGDYHDANVLFEEKGVVGVIDWDKTDLGSAEEEAVRAMHLSFRATSKPECSVPHRLSKQTRAA